MVKLFEWWLGLTTTKQCGQNYMYVDRPHVHHCPINQRQKTGAPNDTHLVLCPQPPTSTCWGLGSHTRWQTGQRGRLACTTLELPPPHHKPDNALPSHCTACQSWGRSLRCLVPREGRGRTPKLTRQMYSGSISWIS